MSSILLSAQTGNTNPDTVRCYGLTELRYIAASLVEGRACDTLLAVANAKLENRDSLIKEKNREINMLNTESDIKDRIIKGKEEDITKLNEKLSTANTQKHWLKIGWLSSTVAFAVLTGYLLLH
jgi:hypothetical protein